MNLQSDYKESFKQNENGLYDFIGSNEDILKIMNYHFTVDRIKGIKQYNEEYMQFYTESLAYDKLDIERDILEDDIAYINCDGIIYNVTYSNIIFFKIKNLEEPEEYFYHVPKALNNFNRINGYRVTDDLLFELSKTIYNTFIEEAELMEIALKYEYGDIKEDYWRLYTFDEYINDLESRMLEEHAFSGMSDEDIERYL